MEIEVKQIDTHVERRCLVKTLNSGTSWASGAGTKSLDVEDDGWECSEWVKVCDA